MLLRHAPARRRVEPLAQRPAPLEPTAVELVLAAQRGAGNAAVSRVLARSQDPETEADPEFREHYERELRTAIGLLEAVGFGRAEGTGPFTDGQEHYDKEYWLEGPALDKGAGGARLVLRKGKLPSAAIDAMFADLGSWTLDCAQYVQVAELYAMRHARGTEAFDAGFQDMTFEFRPFASSGLKVGALYSRARPGDPMLPEPQFSDAPKEFQPPQTPVPAEELVRGAPIGSRVTWRNLAAPPSSAFYNENTVKLGDDQYAAHGFEPKTMFTGEELELALAGMTLEREADPATDSAYIAENVFVIEVQTFRIY
jgi:hypothetical protein